MYFISKGDCAVTVVDQDGNTEIIERLLTKGDHFGEIGLIYKCRRTASVISRNYNTMARIAYSHYRDVASEYPEFEKLMKTYSFRYKDKRKKFLIGLIRKVYYLN